MPCVPRRPNAAASHSPIRSGSLLLRTISAALLTAYGMTPPALPAVHTAWQWRRHPDSSPALEHSRHQESPHARPVSPLASLEPSLAPVAFVLSVRRPLDQPQLNGSDPRRAHFVGGHGRRADKRIERLRIADFPPRLPALPR